MLEYQDLLTPELIWGIEQNKPSLVAKDLQAFGVPPEITHSVLLARGVYKWLSVRRHIIKLKNVWKARIVETLAKLKEAKRSRNDYEVGYLRGYLKAYEECRGEVRALCHSERWQAPDFDRKAQAHLRGLTLFAADKGDSAAKIDLPTLEAFPVSENESQSAPCG